MDPITQALLGAGISAGGSVLSGLLGRQRGGETGEQKRDRQLIDELLASLSGQGQFADLFQADEETFNRLIGDPARQRFQTRTAPQIQQEFIASGQQRGTGLEDTLTRAGVDLDTLINQQFGQFQQQQQGAQRDLISNILGQRTGAQERQSLGSAASQAGAGFLTSPGFTEGISSILDALRKDQPGTRSPRAGFAQ